jgi:peptidoglycan/LPS O-acetylase OafA/YrhL
MKPGELRKVVGLSIGAIAVMVPGTLEWQTPGVASTPTLLVAAMLGGAVGGRVLAPPGERIRVHLAAIAFGAIAAAGAFAVTRWWVRGRDEVMAVEIMFAMLIGALPGALVGQWVHGRQRRRSDG